MVRMLLGCAVAFMVGVEQPSSENLETYQLAQATAGRDVDKHIKLALWCESHGMPSERLKHLATAVLIDPDHAVARGLLGQVSDQGKWRKPEAVSERVLADAKLAQTLAEYQGRREKMPNTADAHSRLAQWCTQNGLDAEAKAHLAAVVRLDPSRDKTWRELGFKKHKGRWVTEEQQKTERAEAEAVAKGNERWKPLLTKWKLWLRDKANKERADQNLAAVTDPYAVNALMQVFGNGNEADQQRAVGVLGRLEGASASKALATLAVLADSAETRRIAVETLVRRDPRDVLDLLIGEIRPPYKYEIRPVGPGMPGILFVEGEQFNVERIYNVPRPDDRTWQILAERQQTLIARAINEERLNMIPDLRTLPPFEIGSPPVTNSLPQPQGFRQVSSGRPPVPEMKPVAPSARPPVPAQFTGNAAATPAIPTTPNQAFQTIRNALTTPDPNEAAAQQVFDRARQMIQQENTVLDAQLSRRQRGAVRNADRYFQALSAAQQQLERDTVWLESYNQLAEQSNQRVLLLLTNITGHDYGTDREAWNRWWADQNGLSFVSTMPNKPTFRQQVPLDFVPQYERTGSCFAAGTLVRTREGLRPIESLLIGDVLLTQDTKSGQLSYQPIVAVFHNPPNQTVRVSFGDDEIVATGIHRFWKSGTGWVMARELKAGDTVRTVGGLRTVQSVEPDRIQPVFNLEVASGRSFFVGRVGALVHDNSLLDLYVKPFDAAPELALGKVRYAPQATK